MNTVLELTNLKPVFQRCAFHIGLRIFERYKGLSIVKLPFPQKLNEFLAQLVPLGAIGLAIHFRHLLFAAQQGGFLRAGLDRLRVLRWFRLLLLEKLPQSSSSVTPDLPPNHSQCFRHCGGLRGDFCFARLIEAVLFLRL